MKVQFHGVKREVRASDINVDSTYQRKLNFSFVQKIVESFDAFKFGVLHVSRRHDGTHWVVDGQHRLSAIRGFGEKWVDVTVPCIVYDGLSRQQEADLFRGLNGFHSVRPFDMFRSEVEAGDPIAVQIETVATGLGFTLHDSATRGLPCVVALKKIMRGITGSINGAGGANLRRVLAIVAGAYGTKPPHPTGTVVEGIGLVVEKHGAVLDPDRLIRKLRQRAGGKDQLLGDGRQKQRAEGGSLSVAIAELVIKTYNVGVKKNVLGSIRSEGGR